MPNLEAELTSHDQNSEPVYPPDPRLGRATTDVLYKAMLAIAKAYEPETSQDTLHTSDGSPRRRIGPMWPIQA